jgi:stage V sporulation protein AE
MNIFMDFLKVFICGGLLCALAQIIIDKTKLTPARILVGYVVAGVILTAVGLYEPFVDFAKSGATVPLSGFGFALAKGVQQAVADKGLLGVLTGGLTATAAGIAAVILFAGSFALIFNSKEK